MKFNQALQEPLPRSSPAGRRDPSVPLPLHEGKRADPEHLSLRDTGTVEKGPWDTPDFSFKQTSPQESQGFIPELLEKSHKTGAHEITSEEEEDGLSPVIERPRA